MNISFLQNGSVLRTYFLKLNAQTSEADQQAQWRLAKYSCLIGILFFQYIFQDSCQKTIACSAVNWKYSGNYVCILRACSLPVVPPMMSLPMWKAYYVAAPTTTTTITTTTTSTTTSSTFIPYGSTCFLLGSNSSY